MQKQMTLTKSILKTLEVEWVEWIDGWSVLMEGICWWKKHVDGWKADRVSLFAYWNMRKWINCRGWATLTNPESGWARRTLAKCFEVTPHPAKSSGFRWEQFGWKRRFGESVDKRETESNSDLKDLLVVKPRSLTTSSWGTPGSTSVVQMEAWGSTVLVWLRTALDSSRLSLNRSLHDQRWISTIRMKTHFLPSIQRSV